MKFKKLMLVPLLAVVLSGCTLSGSLDYELYNDAEYRATVDSEGYTLIDFYALNDFHGALTYDEESTLPGIGKLNTFLKNKRSENPGGTVLLASGDMWQGSADSNLTRGEIVVHTMNHMGFAAMALGNHEFDWTIDVIRDNKEIANFPFLGANIIQKSDGAVVDFVDESPLIERDGVKIGIIGTIGSDLENTIQTGLISEIEFDKITTYVESESTRLRNDGADLVVLTAHDTWISNIDNERSPIIDEKMVDAVFTGHQHEQDDRVLNGIPILQGKAYGRDVQHITLGYHKTTKDVKLVESGLIKDIAKLDLAKDKTSESIYNYFYKKEQIGKIKNERLGRITNSTMTRLQVANFAVEVMAKTYEDEVVGAMHNVNGGIRAEFRKGYITYGDIYQAFPFDNELYLVSISGSRLKGFSGGNFAYYWTVDVSTLVNSERYYIVTTNFVYELPSSPFGANDEYINKFTYPRDIIADYIRTHKTINGDAY